MLKKALVITVAVACIVCAIVVPASATEIECIDYSDLITDVVVDGENDIVTISLPLDMIRISNVDKYGNTVGSSTGETALPGLIGDDVGYCWVYRIHFNDFLLLADDIPNDTQYAISCELFHEGDPQLEIYTDQVSVRESYWDENIHRIYYEVNPFLRDQNLIGSHSLSGSINKPAGTYALGFELYFWGLFANSYPARVFLRVDSLVLTFSINSLLRLQQTSGKTNQILKEVEKQLEEQGKTLDEINDRLDKLPGEMGDEFQDIIDNEKQEASSAGDSAAGELMDIIPDKSQGFMDAIQSLVSSMSYSGTEAKLPVPATALPAIPGVMDEIRLTDELAVDFGYWVQKLPSEVLELVQILGTIALIVYCFKELYSMIAYAMTLKGGGSNE